MGFAKKNILFLYNRLSLAYHLHFSLNSSPDSSINERIYRRALHKYPLIRDEKWDDGYQVRVRTTTCRSATSIITEAQ